MLRVHSADTSCDGRLPADRSLPRLTGPTLGLRPSIDPDSSAEWEPYITHEWEPHTGHEWGGPFLLDDDHPNEE